MDLRQAVRIWRARWILTSVLLILAIVGAAGAAAKIPRSYQSTSTDAVSRELMAPGTVRQLAAQGFTASYAVALPTYTTSTTGSVLTVTVTGPHAAKVERTLQAVTAQIGTQLAQLQHGVPAHSQVDADTLSITPQATLSVSQTARPLVVVGAVLLVICFGIPIVLDGLLTRRQLRNRSRGVRSRRVSERASGRSAVHDLQDSA